MGCENLYKINHNGGGAYKCPMPFVGSPKKKERKKIHSFHMNNSYNKLHGSWYVERARIKANVMKLENRR